VSQRSSLDDLGANDHVMVSGGQPTAAFLEAFRLAIFMIALLIAVFPANLYLYQHQEILPPSPLVHLPRLPLQGVFVLWVYWHTRKGEA